MTESATAEGPEREYNNPADLLLQADEEHALREQVAEHLTRIIADEDVDLNMAAARAEMPYDKFLDQIRGTLDNASIDDLIRMTSWFGFDIEIMIDLKVPSGDPKRVATRVIPAEKG